MNIQDEGKLLHILQTQGAEALVGGVLGLDKVTSRLITTELQAACRVGSPLCVQWALSVLDDADIYRHIRGIWFYVINYHKNYPAIAMLLARAGAHVQDEFNHAIRHGAHYEELYDVHALLRMFIDHGARAGPSSLHQSANLDLLMYATEYQTRVDAALQRYVILEGLRRRRTTAPLLPDLVHLIARQVWKGR